MSRKGTGSRSNRIALRRAFICSAAAILLPLLPPGRAAAQSAAGPLPAASPSDQPPQPAAGSNDRIAGRPNLAGTWKLNSDQSDSPREKMREAQQESGGGYGRGGYGDRQQNRDDQRNGENRQRGGGQAMAQLVIEQTPTSVKVSDSSGRAVAVYQAQPQQGSSGSSSSNSDTNPALVAQWQDSKLITTTQMPNGGTTTRSYGISSDNKQLIVTTKIDSKRLKEPVTIRQVYDAVNVSTGGD